MRLIFAGTPSPAVVALEALLASHHDIVAVVTRPDAPAGRGRTLVPSPVSELARSRGIEVLTPTSPGDPDFISRFTEFAPDCAPIVAFGGLITPALLDVPKFGWVNLHFSLLPRWRGAAPVQHAIWNGDDVTGATTFVLEQGLDTGPILGQVIEEIDPRDTSGALLDRLSVVGAQLLVDTIDSFENGTARAIEQSSDGVTTAPKISVADAQIDWRSDAESIDRQIRACTPHPGAWTSWGDQRIKIGPVSVSADSVEVSLGAPGSAPGSAALIGHHVVVTTGGLPVQLGLVQPPGKKLMPAIDWWRGLRSEDVIFS
jgi:methionyl-tRNA formyltransferase